MEFSELLQPYLDSPLFDQLLPYLWASLGVLVCFVAMLLLVIKWKKRYQNLQAEHQRFSDRVEIETRVREEKIDLLESTSRNMRLEFKTLAQEIFDEKTRILTTQICCEQFDFIHILIMNVKVC